MDSSSLECSRTSERASASSAWLALHAPRAACPVVLGEQQEHRAGPQPRRKCLPFPLEVALDSEAKAGGKGANLGELSRVVGVSVPPGFCVTTNAFARIVAGAPLLDDQLDRLSRHCRTRWCRRQDA